MSARVLVLAGAGGVGKTTVAAAAAVGLADAGARTAVLTVDPARRLAQALGVAGLGGRPAPVAAVPGLDAAMLDQDERFRELLARSGSAELAGNPVALAVARGFGGLQEYLAMDLLGELHAAGGYDAIVVDTPPAGSALDFLDSADRMARLTGHPLMRLLTGSSAVLGAGVGLLGRVVGGRTLAEAADFARAVAPVTEEVLARSRAMRAVLAERGEVALVAAPAAEPLRIAARMAAALAEQGLPPRALVVNRTHPVPAALAGVTPPERLAGADPVAWAGLREVHAARVALAAAEARQVARARRRLPGPGLLELASVRGGVAGTAELRLLAGRLAPLLAG